MALGAAMQFVPSPATAAEAPPRIAVLALRDGAQADESLRILRDELAKGVAKGAPTMTVLGSPAIARAAKGDEERERREAVRKGTERAAQGRALAKQLEFEKAVPEFEAARALLLEGLAAQTDGTLTAVLVDLGAALVDLNQTAKAQETFRLARQLGGPDALDSKAYSPRAIAAHREAMASLKGTLDGALSITVTPPGAKVFVDGRPVGSAPVVVRDLSDGGHLVRAELPGRPPAISQGTTGGARTIALHLRVPGAPPAAFDRGIDFAMTPEDLFKSALAAGETVGADLVVLAGPVRARDASPGAAPRLQTMLVDVRNGLLIDSSSLSNGDPTAAGAAAGAKLAAHRKEMPAPVVPVLRIEGP